MNRYRVFQRDVITGHMNVIADVECRSDLEAARIGRKYAAGEDVIMCQGERIIHLCARPTQRTAPAQRPQLAK